MFCIGCASQLPDFAATGTSTLEVMRPLKLTGSHVGPRAADDGRPQPRAGVLPVGWAWLALFAAASTVAVAAGLNAMRTHPAAAPGNPSNASSSAIEPTSSRNLLALTQADAALQSLRATELRATELRARLDTRAAEEPRSDSIDEPQADSSALQQPVVAEAEANGESPALRQVRRFYRALSEGDGAAAARLVIPEKRDSGPLSAREMSQFYRSLNEPLRLGSVRQLGADVFEATYSYTASRTRCRATAIVRTVAGDARPLIRSIRANC